MPFQRVWRALVVVAGHVILCGALFSGIWLLAWYSHILWGQEEHKLYGKVPLGWLLDTVDAGLLVVFALSATVEVLHKLGTVETLLGVVRAFRGPKG